MKADTKIPEPEFHVPVIKMRQPDGGLLVKAGKPEIVASEVSVSVFSKETGVSTRHIATLCEQGLIQHRRLTPKKDSKILIPRDEIARFRSLDDESSGPPRKPPGDLAGIRVPAEAPSASYPSAKHRETRFKSRSHPRKT